MLATSWISAEFSAMTMLGVPAAAYQGDWSLLQFFFGSALARLAVAFVFLRRLYGEGPNLYGFLESRFGRGTRLIASAFFVSVRTLSSSVRLMAVATIVASFLNTADPSWAVIFAVVAILSVSGGGVRAAVWTGCFQAIAIVVGGLAVFFYLIGSFEGGMAEALRVASHGDHLAVWSWKAPAAILTGFFGSLATFGTDQEMMQRLFSARSRLSAQRAVIFAAVGAVCVLMLFLAIGTSLFVFYDQRPALALPLAADSVLPHFAFQAMSLEYRALLLAAFVLASIDLPLVGLSTVFPGPGSGGVSGLRRLRVGSALWGVAICGLAFILANNPGYLWLGFKIGGVVYGPMLGIFAVGFFGSSRSDWAAMAALSIAAVVCGGALAMMESGLLLVEWRWLPILGAGLGASLTEIFSRLFQSDRGSPQEKRGQSPQR